MWPGGDGFITITAVLGTVFGSQPIEGIRVRACYVFDPPCANPIAESFSDATGYVAVTVPAGYDGYLEIVKDGYFPILFFANPPPIENLDVGNGFGMFTESDFANLAAAGGVTLTPGRGHLLTQARECTDTPAEGVEMSLTPVDDMTTRFYLVGSFFPSTSATTTTSNGYAGFLNVPVALNNQFVTLEGRLPAYNNALVGTSAAMVRSDFLTVVYPFIPTPTAPLPEKFLVSSLWSALANELLATAN